MLWLEMHIVIIKSGSFFLPERFCLWASLSVIKIIIEIEDSNNKRTIYI